jgi:two-component system sensor histidine kinase HydH
MKGPPDEKARTGKPWGLQRRYAAIPVVILTLAVTFLHYAATAAGHALHDIYRELYYIPLLLGALAYGLKGAACSYLLVFLLYLPYLVMTWTGADLYEANRLLQLLVQGLFAFLAGYLVDRERRQREQSEEERYFAGIGRTATAIVHDLKSPLIAILGFAERIKKGKGQIDAEATVIIESAGQMQQLVHSVLDFVKPAHLELKEEDVRDVIVHASDVCRARAEQAGVTLVIDQPVDSIIVSMDSTHMERALVNLIVNAVEASTTESHVFISAVKGKTYVTVTIKDDGSGMDSTTLENIFVPFHTKKVGGTGLGMAIVKKVIEGHHGKIRIKSKPGRGTEAIIELPYPTVKQ